MPRAPGKTELVDLTSIADPDLFRCLPFMPAI